MNKEILRTERLSVGYNKKVLIGDINISVNRGQIVTLIGPNGAGKSTILKTLSTQILPVLGNIYIDKKNIKNIKPCELAKIIAVVTTAKIETELMTCYDVISLGRYPYTGQLGILSENDKNKIKESMKLTFTEELANTDFSCISDGQKQRVLLAKAICQEPEILILDEPSSFLDIRHKLELIKILKKLVVEKNTAVIMSMHELNLAEKISDFTVCVKEGRIDKCGKSPEVFSNEYICDLYDIDLKDLIFNPFSC